MALRETDKDNLQTQLLPVHDVVHRPSTFGRLQDIGLAFAVVSIPLSILSVALLGAVLGFQIDTSNSTNLGPGQEAIAGYYIVQLSATTIALIASYSSTVAPIAVGFAMTLLSYPIANDIIKYSERKQFEKLPTPYQLGLMINLRSGSVGSLWPWFKYTFRWRVRHKTVGVVKAFTLGVTSALLLTSYPQILNLTIGCWLHWQIHGCILPQSRQSSFKFNPTFLLISLSVEVRFRIASARTQQILATPHIHALYLKVLANIISPIAVKALER